MEYETVSGAEAALRFNGLHTGHRSMRLKVHPSRRPRHEPVWQACLQYNTAGGLCAHGCAALVPLPKRREDPRREEYFAALRRGGSNDVVHAKANHDEFGRCLRQQRRFAIAPPPCQSLAAAAAPSAMETGPAARAAAVAAAAAAGGSSTPSAATAAVSTAPVAAVAATVALPAVGATLLASTAVPVAAARTNPAAQPMSAVPKFPAQPIVPSAPLLSPAGPTGTEHQVVPVALSPSTAASPSFPSHPVIPTLLPAAKVAAWQRASRNLARARRRAHPELYPEEDRATLGSMAQWPPAAAYPYAAVHRAVPLAAAPEACFVPAGSATAPTAAADASTTLQGAAALAMAGVSHGALLVMDTFSGKPAMAAVGTAADPAMRSGQASLPLPCRAALDEASHAHAQASPAAVREDEVQPTALIGKHAPYRGSAPTDCDTPAHVGTQPTAPTIEPVPGPALEPATCAAAAQEGQPAGRSPAREQTSPVTPAHPAAMSLRPVPQPALPIPTPLQPPRKGPEAAPVAAGPAEPHVSAQHKASRSKQRHKRRRSNNPDSSSADDSESSADEDTCAHGSKHRGRHRCLKSLCKYVRAARLSLYFFQPARLVCMASHACGLVCVTQDPFLTCPGGAAVFCGRRLSCSLKSNTAKATDDRRKQKGPENRL